MLPPHGHVHAVPPALQRGEAPPQAIAQQVPVAAPVLFGTQWPLVHDEGAAVEQVAPFGFTTVQVPPLVARSHHFPEPHCMSVVQGPHAVALAQKAVAHAAETWEQAPDPLQAPTGVPTAFEQLAVPHALPDVGYRQLSFVPSQVPAHVPAPVQPTRPPRGLPVIKRQVPGEPASLQDEHWPLQAELQHT